MEGSFDRLLAEGHAAISCGDGAAARRAFEGAAEIERTAEVLEGLGYAAYLEVRFAEAGEHYEQAFAAYRERGDDVEAVRCARRLSYIYGAVIGDGAVMSGWLARARSILKDDDCVERGWNAVSTGMFEEDREAKNAHLQQAIDIARRFGVVELELVASAYLGASMVRGNQVEEGMQLLDEALAGVAGREVKDFLSFEEIFCQLFAACEYARDVQRADSWIRVGDEIARRRQLPGVSAHCRTHYGGVLTNAGRWAEADVALSEATRIWSLGWGPLRGGALLRLADLRVRQGRYEEALQLLDGMETYSEAAHPLASLHLARQEFEVAADVIERALDEIDPFSIGAGTLYALLVDIHIARGDVQQAATALERLEEIATSQTNIYLKATVAFARGRLCVASGGGDATSCFREALAGFAKAQMPVELAQARLELARAMSDDRPEVALAEAKAALAAFEELQVDRHADAAAALLRDLGGPARTGPKTGEALTKREQEVLELLGHGLSNPEISDRLYISRKTVEHHVGRVLAKLGLRSRAEAAAFAARQQKPAPR